MALQTKHFYAFGPYRLDSEKRVLVRDGTPVPLAPKASEILLVLVEHAGHLVDKDSLISRVWPDAFVEEGNLNKNIFFLRKALGTWDGEREYVETVPKRGYRFIAPVSEVTHAESAPHLRSASATNLTGKKVSHYRVLDILGGGGMGVVYRAEDLKLGRLVALKFLPEESAKDPAALSRFEREARAASALEHPNICPIYEFGEHEGQPFLAMQLLEGRTLRESISAGSCGNPPFALSKLLDLASQIITGLDAAHRQGMIHRDIKPANIFITSDGQAKILDFGLAKLALLASDAQDNSDPHVPARGAGLETLHERRLTTTAHDFQSLTGVAMGTAGYMSPEQVRGEKLDARTDLFSFGLVLYEMATGKRAFAGDSGAQLQEAILMQTPTQTRKLNPEIPVELSKIVHKTLEKDREARYQSALEIHDALESLKRELESGSRPAWKTMAAAVILLFFMTSVGLWFTRRQSASSSPLPEIRLRQLTTNSSENATKTGTISPDGKYLAYTDRLGMHIKLIDGVEARTIPQPDEFNDVFVDWEIGPWFPDGTRFLADAHQAIGDASNWTAHNTSIWMVSLLGGPPRKLRGEAYADSISADGSTIAFQANPGRFGDREIWLMGANGDNARKLYGTDESSAIVELNWSPDGKQVLYRKIDESGQNLVTRDLRGGPPAAILSPSVANRLNDFLWLPDGRVIYALWESDRASETCNYWQLRIDPRTGRPVERPRRVTNWTGFCAAATSSTADSRLLSFLQWKPSASVYVADLQAGGGRIANTTRLTLDVSFNEPLGWTSDGKSVIFFSNRNGKRAIFKQVLGQDSTQFVPSAKEDHDALGRACLSSDASEIYYMVQPMVSTPLAKASLMRVPTSGGTPQLVLKLDSDAVPHCAKSPVTLCVFAERSSNREELVFSAFDPAQGRGRELARSDTTAESDYYWDLSPDGSRIAVLEDGQPRVQILSLTGGAPQEVIAKGWDKLSSVNWTADGKALFVTASKTQSPVLLWIDLQGNARVLWSQPGMVNTSGLPSTDGRHLAIMNQTNDTNMWMMANF